MDTAAQNTGNAQTGYYATGLISSSGSIGSYNFSTGTSNLTVGREPAGVAGAPGPSDIFYFTAAGAAVTGAPVGGAPLYSVGFMLRDDTATALPNGSVPLSLSLALFSPEGLLKKLNLIFTGGEIIGAVTSLSVISSTTAPPATTPPPHTRRPQPHHRPQHSGRQRGVSASATAQAVTDPAVAAALPVDPPSMNQLNVATGIDRAIRNGATVPNAFIPLYLLSGTALENVMTQLSGEAATGAQQGAFQLASQFLNVMLDPFVYSGAGIGHGPALGLAAERETLPADVARAYAKAVKAPVDKPPPPFEQRWSMWASGYGGYNHTDGDPAVVGSHDLSARAFGFAGGFDYHFSPDTVAGFALAGGGTNWGLAQGLGGGRSDAFQAGAYAVTRSGPWYLAGAFAFTNHWMSTDRFAAFGDHLTADFNAQSFGGRAEGGYRFATVVGGVAPYAALQAQSFRTPSYNETDVTGGAFALSYIATPQPIQGANWVRVSTIQHWFVQTRCWSCVAVWLGRTTGSRMRRSRRRSRRCRVLSSS